MVLVGFGGIFCRGSVCGELGASCCTKLIASLGFYCLIIKTISISAGPSLVISIRLEPDKPLESRFIALMPESISPLLPA